jgi:hypothetical protein
MGEREAEGVTDGEAVAYLDRIDPHGTRSLSAIRWAKEQVATERMRIENAGLRAEVERLRTEADHSKCRAIGEWYGVPAYAWGDQ